MWSVAPYCGMCYVRLINIDPDYLIHVDRIRELPYCGTFPLQIWCLILQKTWEKIVSILSVIGLSHHSSNDLWLSTFPLREEYILSLIHSAVIYSTPSMCKTWCKVLKTWWWTYNRSHIFADWWRLETHKPSVRKWYMRYKIEERQEAVEETACLGLWADTTIAKHLKTNAQEYVKRRSFAEVKTSL